MAYWQKRTLSVDEESVEEARDCGARVGVSEEEIEPDKGGVLHHCFIIWESLQE